MILISIGHNPYKKGARFRDHFEYDEAKQWAPLIANYLGSDGMLVPTGLLKEKVDFINAHKPTLAMEIHFNSYKKWNDKNKDGIVDEDELIAQGKGCETLYCPGSEKGKALASAIQSTLADFFFPDRGIKEGWFRMKQGGTPDYFLQYTKCPAIIIEPDFIHRIKMIQEQREPCCAALATTLLDYYRGLDK